MLGKLFYSQFCKISTFAQNKYVILGNKGHHKSSFLRKFGLISFDQMPWDEIKEKQINDSPVYLWGGKEASLTASTLCRAPESRHREVGGCRRCSSRCENIGAVAKEGLHREVCYLVVWTLTVTDEYETGCTSLVRLRKRRRELLILLFSLVHFVSLESLLYCIGHQSPGVAPFSRVSTTLGKFLKSNKIYPEDLTPENPKNKNEAT